MDGEDGHDKLYGGADDDEIHGGAHRDTIEGNAGDDMLFGGSWGDTINGNDGDDEIRGEYGHDTLRGDAGNDVIYGGAGDDDLFGGADDDDLYGGDDDDHLYGGTGRDGLMGGDGKSDVLIGGAAADRFIMKVDDNGSSLDDAEIYDLNDNDAVINFSNGTQTFDKDGINYGPGVWTYEHIEWVDQGLSALHKLSDAFLSYKGDDLTFVRQGSWISGKGAYGWTSDSSSTIYLADAAFGGICTTSRAYCNNYGADMSGREFATEVTIHEIGHKWEDENDKWNEFKEISEWERSGGDWSHDGSAGFASLYAMTDPLEDFAESFTAYVLDRVGLSFYGDVVDDLGISAMPEKAEVCE